MIAEKDPSARTECPAIEKAVGKPHKEMIAELALTGAANGATLVANFSKGGYGDIDLTECIRALGAKVRAVRDGDLSDVEAVLISQALALDSIFTYYARLAYINTTDHFEASERLMRLGLKAQGQCRATLEALAAIKNPPLVLARQANITSGPQQVNNHGHGCTALGSQPAENLNSVQNELLEKRHEQWMDSGAAVAAGEGNPAMAALDEIDRP